MKPHILIIRFSALGDVAMLAPVVYSLAVQYPDIRITVLSRPFARDIFENLAPNVSFMGADLKKDYKGIHGLNVLYRRIVAKKPTHIADCHGVLRTHYLRMRFILGRFKVAHINKHRKEKLALCNPEKKNLRQLSSSFRNYADVIEELGFHITPAFRSLFGDGKGNIRLLPAELHDKKPFQRWIGIAPFATHEGKIYPLERMEKVVRMLLEKHPNAKIFLFHGRGEEATKMQEWEIKFNRGAQNLAEKRVISASSLLASMGQELILMSHLNLMVSMDSSNMHLASLVACPVLSIWGATHRFAGFLGWNQSPDNCIERDLPCRPCSVYGNRPCIHNDFRCMDISEEEIVKRIEKA